MGPRPKTRARVVMLAETGRKLLEQVRDLDARLVALSERIAALDSWRATRAARALTDAPSAAKVAPHPDDVSALLNAQRITNGFAAQHAVHTKLAEQLGIRPETIAKVHRETAADDAQRAARRARGKA